ASASVIKSRGPRCAMKKGTRPAILVAVVLLAVTVIAEAQQQPKIPRIGVLAQSSAYFLSTQHEVFRQALRELGYMEGKNIVIEYRHAEGKLDRLPGLAGELVRLKVDLIVASSTPAALAAKNAT